MSDEMMTVNSLISQNDIDLLLKLNSIEDPKEKYQATRTTLWMI